MIGVAWKAPEYLVNQVKAAEASLTDAKEILKRARQIGESTPEMEQRVAELENKLIAIKQAFEIK